jgi:SAM-dependent methyltransferase
MDFGCGTGRLLGELLRVADEVVGVDRTPEMLRRARQTGTVPPDRLALWREGPLPFGDSSIDLIMSVYVMMTTDTLELAASAWPRASAEGAVGVLIEQVDNDRGLTPERYNATLATAGFRTLVRRPIRRGVRSPFQRLAASAPWPVAMIDLLARAEIRSMRGRVFTADTSGYWDYLFVIKREPGAVAR